MEVVSDGSETTNMRNTKEIDLKETDNESDNDFSSENEHDRCFLNDEK